MDAGRDFFGVNFLRIRGMETYFQKSKVDFRKIPFVGLLLALGGSAMVTYVSTILLFKNFYVFEVLLGWVLAAGFNLLGLVLRLKAVGRNIKQFFFFSFVLGAFNALVFLILICFCIRNVRLNTDIFVSSIFIAYFFLLIYDIWKLKNLTVKTKTVHP